MAKKVKSGAVQLSVSQCAPLNRGLVKALVISVLSGNGGLADLAERSEAEECLK